MFCWLKRNCVSEDRLFRFIALSAAAFISERYWGGWRTAKCVPTRMPAKYLSNNTNVSLAILK